MSAAPPTLRSSSGLTTVAPFVVGATAPTDGAIPANGCASAGRNQLVRILARSFRVSCARSCSTSPPHSPSRIRCRSANCRQGRCTGHRPQTARALASRRRRAGIGSGESPKKTDSSIPAHAADDCHAQSPGSAANERLAVVGSVVRDFIPVSTSGYSAAIASCRLRTADGPPDPDPRPLGAETHRQYLLRRRDAAPIALSRRCRG